MKISFYLTGIHTRDKAHLLELNNKNNHKTNINFWQ